MALNLTAFEKKTSSTSNLNLSAFGIKYNPVISAKTTTPITSVIPKKVSVMDVIKGIPQATVDVYKPLFQPTVNIATNIVKNTWEIYKQTPSKLIDDIKAGASDIQKGGTINKNKGELKTGLRTAGDSAIAIFSPLSGAIGAILEEYGGQKLVDKAGQVIADKSGITNKQWFQKYAIEHPNAGEDFNRILMLAMSGGEKGKVRGEKVVKEVETTARKIVKQVRETEGKQAGFVKNPFGKELPIPEGLPEISKEKPKVLEKPTLVSKTTQEISLKQEELQPKVNTTYKETIQQPLTKRQEKLSGLTNQVNFLEEQLQFHPGKELQRLISKKEGQYMDQLNPDRVKTMAETKRIIAKNEKANNIAVRAFERVGKTDLADNPDEIRNAIDEYQSLKESIDGLKNEIRKVKSQESLDKISKKLAEHQERMVDFANKYPKLAKLTMKMPEKMTKGAIKGYKVGEEVGVKTGKEIGIKKGYLKGYVVGEKRGVVQYKKEQSFIENITKEINRELSKPKGQQRSVISFVKQLGEFNQTVMSEIKKDLGIAKPLKDMNLEELKDFTTKLKERLKFKFEKGYKPSVETKEKLNLKNTPKPTLNETDYIKNRELSKGKITFKNKVTKVISKTDEGAEKTLTPISTRLENIDPSLKTAMRRFEYDAMQTIQKGKLSVSPYLKKLKKSIEKDNFSDLDLAFKNGDITKINEINKKYGIEKEYDAIRNTLDDIYKRANEVGFDVGYQKNYIPRMIKDIEGFLEYFGKQEYWSILDEAIKRKEMDLGRYLTQEEKASLINTMVRGYQGGQITLSGTGAMKERIIDLVTPEINKFYYDSPTSLIKYVEEVNDKIAARKFFGKGNKAEGFNNVEDSIGAYTTDLLAKGKITPKQEFELRDMLNARFNAKGTHGIVGLYKNLAYMDVMGSFLNAVTQLGDQAWSLYRNGLLGTLKADIKSITGKSKITKESLGIEASRIAQEFSDVGKTAKAVDKLFELIGLNKMDRFGKESLVNGAIEKYQKLAKNPDIDFLKKLDDIFEKESGQVLLDLKSGEITENVKFLAFNELLDFHPVALSEMPEMYLKGGNGRIFYMLKSYTLKQFDIFRREAFRKMARGNVWKGTKNLLSLASLVIICNGTADEIKDLLTGRKTKLSDRVIDQIATLAGFSRYSLGKISEVGLGSALIGQIIPPTNFIDNMSKDLINLYKDFDKSADINQLKTVQDIPLIGKFYYWWFGKGAENTKKYTPKKTTLTNKKLKTPVGLPELPSLKKTLLTPPGLPPLPKL